MASYLERVRSNIMEALRHSPCTFEELVRKCHGVYPVQAKQVLDGLNIYTKSTTLYVTQDELIPPGIKTTVDEQTRGLVTYRLENNPILSSWYFSWQTCQKVGLIDLWQNKKILFLGTPRLFEYFVINGKSDHCRLIDLDKTVADELRKKYDSSELMIDLKDINKIEIFNEKYDVVFMDPPWYFESYCSWLSRALRFVRKDGTVFFPIFPYLTRPTASVERQQIYSYCRKAAKTVLSVPDFFEYDIPSFERQELANAGFTMFSNWKVSDLIILRDFTSDIPHSDVKIGPDYGEWTEFQLSNTRWFLHKGTGNKDVTHSALPLVSLVGDSPYLSSPSRRNPQLKRTNLQSSKGHALFVSDTELFLDLVSKIKKSSLPVNDTINNFEMDDGSKELLNSVLEETQ